MRPSSLALTAALAVLVRAPAATQQPVRNPHGKLREECAVCHAPEAWVPARVSSKFDHAKQGFALAGAHAQAACRSCHASLDFRGAPSDCMSCHKDVHRGEFGTDCARCHTPRNFLDRSVMVGAHQLTRFALNGAHLTVDCEACHTPTPQGRLAFVNVPVRCVECHLPQYQAAKNPDHIGGGFSQECSQCHAATIWTSARFNHDASGFPLTGAHRSAACQQCHGDGVYAGKSTACVSCHQQDYSATTNPNHAAAAFATTCQDCHTTAGWTGAAFNHTWFRLPHHGAQCSDCHTTAPNYATFVCTDCHAEAPTARQHVGVNGYVWNSANCYACHSHGGG